MTNNINDQEFTLYAAFDGAASGILVEAYRAKRSEDAPAEITELRELKPTNAPFSFSKVGEEWAVKTDDWKLANTLIAIAMDVVGLAEQIKSYQAQKNKQADTLVRELLSGKHQQDLTLHSLSALKNNPPVERPPGFIQTGPVKLSIK